MLDLSPREVFPGRRILVVEDDYITAEDIRAELELVGAEVIGPVADLAGALHLLASDAPPDVALLDINLGGEMVYPVADVLRDRHIPFVFVTGYDVWSIPEPYASLPRLEKPLDVRRLAQALMSYPGASGPVNEV